MNQIELEPETRAVLDRIRHSSKVLSIFEMPADLAEAAVWEIGRALVDNQHLPMIQQHSYRWFLREVAKLLRTKTGWDLALELEIALRKWVGYKVDSLLTQALLRECCERIAAMTPEEVEERQELTTRTQRHEEGAPKKRTSADDADPADCVPAPGTNNERRCTSNEGTTTGVGNGKANSDAAAASALG